MTGTLAAEAGEVALEVAARLMDAAAVARRWEQYRLGSGHRVEAFDGWAPQMFCNGYPGIATLFAELAVGAPELRASARTHLAAGAAAAGACRGIGVMTGVAGIGHAARAVAAAPGDCARLIAQCDVQVENSVRGLLRGLRLPDDARRLRTGHFDLVTGVTGAARYLLRAMGPDSPLVAEATRWLAELCLVDDAEPGMPRWATYERHGPVHVADRVESRQLNLGLAHGIIGPLAYLSIALRAGVAVPEARVAVGRLVDWLESWRGRGAHGTNWPSYVSEEEERGRGLATHADRGAWCYGTPGITRALHLAASALGDESLRARAVEIWIEHLEGQLDSPGLGDVGLCHGWAGLLRIAQLMNEDGPERDDGRSERIVQRILECWQPSAPLGFVYNTLDPTRWADSPALLDGAAGTAAALWSYANPGAGRGFWEEALLLC